MTKIAHPWKNGQVESMDRTLKEATVLKYHDDTHIKRKDYIKAFFNAYNFGKRLKTLNGHTPYEYIMSIFKKKALYLYY